MAYMHVGTETKCLKATTLWTNPAPAGNFETQTIQLSDDLRNYDYYEIVCRISTGIATRVTSGLVPISDSVMVVAPYVSIRRRDFTPSSGNILAAKGMIVNTYGSSASNDISSVIPCLIIGFKNS